MGKAETDVCVLAIIVEIAVPGKATVRVVIFGGFVACTKRIFRCDVVDFAKLGGEEMDGRKYVAIEVSVEVCSEFERLDVAVNFFRFSDRRDSSVQEK